MVRSKSQEDSLKHRAKTKNDARDKLAHLMQRFEQGLALDNLRLAERYIAGELHLLLEFRVGRKTEEFVASFEREMRYFGRFEDFVEIRKRERLSRMAPSPTVSHSPCRSWRDTVKKIRRTNGHNQAVFVDVVQLVEIPEQVISSFLWFDRVDSMYSVLPHTLYFSSELGRHVFRGTVADRKGSLYRGSSATSKDKLISQMVEGTPQVLQSITSDSRQFQWNISDASDVIDKLFRLRIGLGSDFIWRGWPGQKGSDRGIQIKEVLFGPFDFYEN